MNYFLELLQDIKIPSKIGNVFHYHEDCSPDIIKLKFRNIEKHFYIYPTAKLVQPNFANDMWLTFHLTKFLSSFVRLSGQKLERILLLLFKSPWFMKVRGPRLCVCLLFAAATNVEIEALRLCASIWNSDFMFSFTDSRNVFEGFLGLVGTNIKQETQTQLFSQTLKKYVKL